VFFTKTRDALKTVTYLDLFTMASLPIIRHIKIRAHATPYDPAYIEYFAKRAKARKANQVCYQGAAAWA
jgi:RNA-directed DNA polymerase